MARAKYDGVVEAVHYARDGKVAWVRMYERRGTAFSERVILDRDMLVNRLKEGKHYMAGKRLPYMGSTFEVSEELHLFTVDGNELLVTDEHQSAADNLKGIPVI